MSHQRAGSTIHGLDQAWLNSLAGAPTHQEHAVPDLIFEIGLTPLFEMLGVGYKLLLGSMFAAGLASLFTPSTVRDKVAPPQRACQWKERSAEYQEQADKALHIQEQAGKTLQIAQPRRSCRTESPPGGFSQLARLVLERQMFARSG